jgi:predicted nucleotidyltransferase
MRDQAGDLVDGNSDVAEIIRNILAGRNDLAAVYLFGSVAEGTAHALSDVDVAVLFRAGLPDEAMFSHSLEIVALLEAALRRSVDVIALNRASPVLCFQVLQHGRLLFEPDPAARGIFVMYALGRYYDLRPYLDYHQEQLLTRIREEGLGRGYQGHRDALAEARRLSAQLASNADGSLGRVFG